MEHSLEKMELLLSKEELNIKELIQLGYNAGRIGELSGLGRQVWDTIKPDNYEKVDSQLVRIGKLHDLHTLLEELV